MGETNSYLFMQIKFLPPFLRKKRPRRYMTIFYGNDENLIAQKIPRNSAGGFWHGFE
jgi:hypothetical protein